MAGAGGRPCYPARGRGPRRAGHPRAGYAVTRASGKCRRVRTGRRGTHMGRSLPLQGPSRLCSLRFSTRLYPQGAAVCGVEGGRLHPELRGKPPRPPTLRSPPRGAQRRRSPYRAPWMFNNEAGNDDPDSASRAPSSPCRPGRRVRGAVGTFATLLAFHECHVTSGARVIPLPPLPIPPALPGAYQREEGLLRREGRERPLRAVPTWGDQGLGEWLWHSENWRAERRRLSHSPPLSGLLGVPFPRFTLTELTTSPHWGLGRGVAEGMVLRSLSEVKRAEAGGLEVPAACRVPPN